MLHALMKNIHICTFNNKKDQRNILKPHCNILPLKVLFQLRDINLFEMKHACCKCRIGLCSQKHIPKVLHSAGAARRNHRNRQICRKQLCDIQCKTAFCAIVVHGG